MDLLQAFREAEAAGIPRQHFLNSWEQEAKMKQLEFEFRLQQLQINNAGKVQVC